jgi:hypothetical protein
MQARRLRIEAADRSAEIRRGCDASDLPLPDATNEA